MASIWVCEGAGVKKETTTINSMIKTSSQTSNTSQFVCQNQAVLSQKAPSITAFPFFVMTLVIRRSMPTRNPPINPHCPANGVIFFEKMPKAKTATMAGASNDWMFCK